ncbi:MAG: AAA family ATPase [Clostridium sp.]|uniref:ATP-dependent nuclease n=1 Tax=Clostridium sp. TaxID=1506 RepID=UPI001DA70B86|nr:AAA family ATPase [Clostridium sp.]MBS5126142.1 AAA family ATPase [Clostridium sp.]
MRFKKLNLKNFRNFSDIEILLDNKNVIFGMNDMGKTNFLYAIRFLLDKDIRKNGFTRSDYHKNNTENKIEILLELDISDFDESDDTKKIVSEARGVRKSLNSDIFFIKLEAEYNEEEMIGEPLLFWGDDRENLIEMSSNGISFAIDRIFKVIYINPLIDLDSLFIKNKRLLLDERCSPEGDKEIIGEITKLTDKVNENIGKMQLVRSLQSDITDEYNLLRSEEVEIQMKSEMAIKGFFSDIVPYIKKNNDDNYYPTSGDGRRKMLAYSIFNLLNKRLYSDSHIVVYLIEEPENSLHRAMQLSLSHQFFSNESYKYCFISTHSTDILYEMDNAMLLRIYSKEKIVCSSFMYKLPDSFKSDKKKLNREFCNALFAERVLLIEGPSEKVLFEKVMNEINSNFELDGGYILQVNGTYFSTYFKALNGLNITTIVKTDNDLRVKKGQPNKYEVLGINRCNKLIEGKMLPEINIDIELNGKNKVANNKIKKERLKEEKRKLYKENEMLIKEFSDKNIFLSEIDLENDLVKVIGERIAEVLGIELEEAVSYLQNSKLYNMVELVEELNEDDCKKIYESELFKCLKELNNE